VDLGRRDAALGFLRRALAIEEVHLAHTLLFAEDARRLTLAKRLLGSGLHAVSFHVQSFPRSRAAADLGVTSVLYNKGRVQDLVARSHASLRRTLSDEQLSLLEKLSSTRTQYAALTHLGPSTQAIETSRSRLAALERQQDALWAELREVSPQVRALTTPISIADVQSRLPGDAALVEYVRYRVVVGPGNSQVPPNSATPPTSSSRTASPGSTSAPRRPSTPRSSPSAPPSSSVPKYTPPVVPSTTRS
jgi:hypothetical protein